MNNFFNILKIVFDVECKGYIDLAKLLIFKRGLVVHF